MEEKLCSSCGLCMIKEWPAKVRDYYFVTFYYPELKETLLPRHVYRILEEYDFKP